MRFKADDGSDFPEWEEKKIGDVLEVCHGRDYKHLGSGNIPVMGTGGVITYVDEALCNWDCVCIGRKGTINKPIYMNVPFWSVDTLFFTKAKKDNDPLCQFYLFQTINWDRYNEATGVPSLSSTTIESLKVNVPSFPEQQKIASLLSSVDETITLCQRKLDLLTQAKKALMQQIFSRKLRFKADDGSDFPDWEEKKLGDIADNFDSLRVPVTQNERTPGDVPYYGANGIQDYVSGFTHEGEFVLLPEDGANDTRHYPAWVIQRKAWVNNHAHVLRGREGILDNFFLAYRITTMDISKYLVGGGRAKLNAETLTSLNLVIPSLPEQQKIASCLRSADALIDQARVELEQWREVKKSLLQQLFV